MPENTPQVENPEILPDLYMMLEIYDSQGGVILDRVQCLVEVDDGISKRIRDLGIVRRQPDPSDYYDNKSAPIAEMAYASSWSFRKLNQLELNELFWPFQAQRNAEMIVAISIESINEKLKNLASGDIKSTLEGISNRNDIHTSTSATVIWGKTNSDEEFELDMYPVAVDYFDDMAVIHLVDHRYFTNKLNMRDMGFLLPTSSSEVQSSVCSAFGKKGALGFGRKIKNQIAPGDTAGNDSSGDCYVTIDPSCYSESCPIGILADNEVLGRLEMPAVVPDFRSAATSSDARDKLTNTTTSSMYCSGELMMPEGFVIKGGHKGDRILAKNSAWPSATLTPVGTDGDSTLYQFKALTDVFWCEDGWVTGIERSDQVLKRGDQTAADAGEIEAFHLNLPQVRYKTCLRLPLDSDNLGGAGIDYTLDNSSLDNATAKLTSATKWLTSFTNQFVSQSGADHFSGGVVILNVEENADLDPIPFGDLTYMALSNECAYIKFGIFNGSKDTMPIPGRKISGESSPGQSPETPAPEAVVADPSEGETTPSLPEVTGPVLAASCSLVPYRIDAFNYVIPLSLHIEGLSSFDNGRVTHIVGTADDTTTTPVLTVLSHVNSYAAYGTGPTTTAPAGEKVKIGSTMFLAPSSNAKILAMRASVNANSTRTGAWIALEQEC